MKAITTQAVIEGIRARKDRSLGLTVSTPELSSQEKALFMDLQGVPIQLLIEPVDESVEQVEIERDVEEKSQSQRMRSVLFILWKQDKEGMDDFQTYYRVKMEKLIIFLKGKIKDE